MEQQTNKHRGNNGFLNGKKVVLLGGSSGIGLATAKAAAAEGATLIIVSSNQQRINLALQELPDNSKGYTVDLTSETAIKSLFEEIGSLDHLVYTAGENIQLVAINDMAIADAQQFFQLRFWGVFTAVKYAAHYLSSSGSITLTGGIAGQRPGAGWSLGASICAAMEGFTRAMAIELAPVRVNLVSPGIVKTGLWSAMNDADRDRMYQSIGEKLPVRRVGEAEDIAQTYLYLMRQQYSTGQVVVVDGGSVLV